MCVCVLQESAGEPPERPFYEDSDSEPDGEGSGQESAGHRQPYVMDPDHALLLRSTKPLLQSRNAAVSPDGGSASTSGSFRANSPIKVSFGTRSSQLSMKPCPWSILYS